MSRARPPQFRFGEQDPGTVLDGKNKKLSTGRVYVTPAQRNMIALALFAVACGTRFWGLAEPTSVVFDEVHFGKFASHYIKVRPAVRIWPAAHEIFFGWWSCCSSRKLLWASNE
jgi:hypothetical protein